VLVPVVLVAELAPEGVRALAQRRGVQLGEVHRVAGRVLDLGVLQDQLQGLAPGTSPTSAGTAGVTTDLANWSGSAGAGARWIRCWVSSAWLTLSSPGRPAVQHELGLHPVTHLLVQVGGEGLASCPAA